jgi:hypothetical protein
MTWVSLLLFYGPADTPATRPAIHVCAVVRRAGDMARAVEYQGSM